MIKFNFQLFAEPLDIPGIDEDILKELAEEAETEPIEDVADAELVEEKAEELSQEPTVDADNVNKQVEEQDEFEDVKEGQTIPYNRFKTVNDRMKTAESRVKELEEQLKMASSAEQVRKPEVNPPKTEEVSDIVSADTSNFTDEQEKRIYELAAQRVKEKKNYTDEDLEALEYSDDPTAKMRYQRALNNEVNLVVKELNEYAANQKQYEAMVNESAQEFDKYNQKFNSYPDAQERWNFISQERFSQLSQRKQYALKEAFGRLQSKKGTYADIEIVSEYLDKANNEWDARCSGEKPKPKSNKLVEAQKLPKAPGITGGSGSDGVLTNERIADILNTPGAWEKLSKKEQDAILSGRI